jgi:hypothetical protein
MSGRRSRSRQLAARRQLLLDVDERRLQVVDGVAHRRRVVCQARHFDALERGLDEAVDDPLRLTALCHLRSIHSCR